MITLSDNVRFLMPESREYQFAAMAVIQTFVNGYQDRCKANDLTQGAVRFQLHYEICMPEYDMEFFTRCGISLQSAPERLGVPNMTVDLRESRVERFCGSGRHLASVCGLMCGVECRVLPVIRRVEMRTGHWRWLDNPTSEQLLSLKGNEITGIVAHRGVTTYLAASMGLAVIELVNPQDQKNWLTKWQNRFVRVVELTETDDITALLIERAKESVETAAAKMVAERCKIPEVSA